jgi:hypothetical protein
MRHSALIIIFFSLFAGMAQAQASTDKYLAFAIEAYTQQSPLAGKNLAVKVLGSGQSTKDNTQIFRFVLSTGTLGSRRPYLGDWSLKEVKIIDVVVEGDKVHTEDVTLKSLPVGNYEVCFWVNYQNKPDQAGRACFPVNDNSTALFVRLANYGISKKLIPWQQAKKTIMTEAAPEVCDGGFEVPHSQLGWCPWSVSYIGVFKNGGAADFDFDL